MMDTKGTLKCYRCAICDGFGCPGNLPGLGGVFENKNFQLNYSGWKQLFEQQKKIGNADKITGIKVLPRMLRCGPVTGAVENIGYSREEDFYLPYLRAAARLGMGLCVGDGCPDLKLQLGIQALEAMNRRRKHRVRAAFFLKPYPQQRLFERVEWVSPHAEYIGIDIDSYNILTMRNLVSLERKTAGQLEEFRKKFSVPFVIKGVFTAEDIELVREVHPDVVYISNHGGRVETRIGSTADFLAENAQELKKYCSEIWVDGGIREKQDIQTAVFYGADRVIFARPLIHAVFDEELDLLKSALLG